MNGNPNLRNNISPWRIVFFGAVIILIFLIYLFRLFSLQILQAPEWVSLAEENRISEINIASQRGIIFDRNGYVLARNIPSYNVVITAAYLPDDPGAVQEIFRQLSELTGVPINRGELSQDNPYVPCRSDHGIAQIVEYGVTTAPYDPVRIVCDIDKELAMVIKEKSVDWPGVDIEVESHQLAHCRHCWFSRPNFIH